MTPKNSNRMYMNPKQPIYASLIKNGESEEDNQTPAPTAFQRQTQ